MERKNYDLIFSCGAYCIVSASLRKNKLQLESYPFDWLLGFSPILFVRYIKSDFSDYFLKENLVELERVENPENKFLRIKDKTNDVEYMHFFHPEKSFDENYRSIKNKFDRRIKRLLGRIEKSKKILLVYATEKVSEKDEILKSFEELSDIFGKDKMDFIFVIFDPKLENSNSYNHSENTRIVDMHYRGSLNNSGDEWNRFLSPYGLSRRIEKLPDLVAKRARRAFFNLVCCFIPFKKARNDFRRIHGSITWE